MKREGSFYNGVRIAQIPIQELSLRGNRSNLVLLNQIATHLSGARNDRMEKGVQFLYRDLGDRNTLDKNDSSL